VPLKLTPVRKPVLCFGESNGEITVSVTGGTPEYTFLWSDGRTTSTIKDLANGFYTVTVTDANGCTATATFEVTQPARLVIREDHTHITSFGANNGTITLNVSGGTPLAGGIYTYAWVGPEGYTATTANLTNLGPGDYTVTVTDANGCVQTIAVTIFEPDPTIIMTCPPTLRICAFAALPAPYGTLAAYTGAGGKVETDCPDGVNTASFRMISQTSSTNTCPQTVTRIYEIRSNCGNVAFCEQQIILEDYEPPVANPPSFFRLQCFSDLRTLHPVVISIAGFRSIGGSVSDNCTAELDHTIRWIGDERKTFNDCLDTIVRRYVITDRCGNATTTEIPYYLQDNRAPVITAGPATLTDPCDLPPVYPDIAAFRAAGGVVTDNCGTVNISHVKDEVITTGCPRTVRRTYTLFDACGNATEFVQTITINDLQSPVMSTMPPLLVDCDAGSVDQQIRDWLNSASATDNCGNPVITHNFNPVTNQCGAPMTITFTATDACGNTSTTTSTITITDEEAPVFNTITPLTLECSTTNINSRIQAWLSGVTATDNCGTPIVINDFTTITSKCGVPQTVIFTAIDNCGNISKMSSTITITDTRVPVIPAITPLALDCADIGTDIKIQIWLNSVRATDLCGNAVVTHNYTGISNFCGTPLTVTFTATDECGNTSTRNGTITITDNQDPVFGSIAPLIVDCASGSITAQVNNWIASVKATDNCGTPVITHNYAGVTGQCGAPVTVTFTATDNCGRIATTTSTITVTDNTPPTWGVMLRPLVIDCAVGNVNTQVQQWLNSVVATDNCGSAKVTNNFTSMSNLCGAPLTVTFTATDDCGNTRTISSTITVVDDTPPVFPAIPPLNIDCAAGSIDDQIQSWLGAVKATDNCGDPLITHDYISMNNLCGAPLTVTFTATDDCGNSATAKGTISVTDTEKPVFVPVQPLEFDCFNGDISQDINDWLNSVKATDNCGTPVITNNFATFNMINICGRPLYVTFTATDACNNTETYSQYIIIRDNEAPVIGNCPPDQTLDLGSPTPPAADTWDKFVNAYGLPSDNCGIDPGSFVFREEKASSTCAEVITRTWIISDFCGNSDTCRQVITIGDNTPPRFIGMIRNYTVECRIDIPPPYTTWSSFTLSGVTATSLNGIDESSFRYTEEVSPGACPQVTTRTYYISDYCGNSASMVQTITVEDKVKPVLTCPANYTAECVSDVPPALTLQQLIDQNLASDNCDLDPDAFSVTEVIERTDQAYLIYRTYTVADFCGNQASCTQVLSLSDVQAPAITCNDFTIFLGEDGRFVLAGKDIISSVSDNCTADEDLIFTFSRDTIDCEDIGTVVRVTVTVTDEAGNSSSCEAAITVRDNLPPVIICQDITVYLDDKGTATITVDDINNGSYDNCDLEVLFLSKTNFTCNDAGVNIVRLTGRDAAGNIAWCDARVTVIDENPPAARCGILTVMLGPDGRIVINVGDVNNGSSDECGIKDMKLSKTVFTCEDLGENIVTLYVYDPFGNVDSCTAVITIVGNEPPVAQDDFSKALANQNTLLLPLINDSDPNGKIVPSTLTIITPPIHGTLIINGETGSVIYLPDEDYLGEDSFVYSICDDGNYCGVMCDTALFNILVVAENLAPVAVNDSLQAGCFPVTYNILRNDYDPDMDDIFLNMRLVSQPVYGDVTVFQDGTITYTPPQGIAVLDSFRYEICDIGFPAKCDTGTVYIRVFKDENCDGFPDEESDNFFIPEGFSPNGDGVHDFFQIVGIEDFPDAKMMIFNRWGNKLFEKEKYGNLNYWGSHEEAWWWGYSESRWNVGGGKVPVGNYLYILELGNGKVFKGTVMVSY
jgi:gliding motility-associated-like protein